jgi:uncharacterized protein (TIGR03435 family)
MIENAYGLMRSNTKRALSVCRAIFGAALAFTLVAPLSFGVAQASQGGAASNPTMTAGAAANQSQPAASPLLEWDVVSVKPMQTCTSGSGGTQYTTDGLKAFCVPMLFVVEMAYNIREPSRIMGAPDWVKGSSYYDIDTKVSAEDAAAFGKLSRNEKNRMLQPLLKDRFQMKAHLETRETPVYELKVAKGGPRLKSASPDEASKSMIGFNGQGKIEAVSWSIDSLPSLLNAEVGRPVVDRTGLTGKYTFALEYTPAMGAAPDSQGSSIFTAIQEQMGLVLEPARAPIDVLVIESIDRPGAN